jgi:hypothetical protein
MGQPAQFGALGQGTKFATGIAPASTLDHESGWPVCAFAECGRSRTGKMDLLLRTMTSEVDVRNGILAPETRRSGFGQNQQIERRKRAKFLRLIPENL